MKRIGTFIIIASLIVIILGFIYFFYDNNTNKNNGKKSLDNNNYLVELKIMNQEIELSKDKTEYEIYIPEWNEEYYVYSVAESKTAKIMHQKLEKENVIDNKIFEIEVMAQDESIRVYKIRFRIISESIEDNNYLTYITINNDTKIEIEKDMNDYFNIVNYELKNVDVKYYKESEKANVNIESIEEDENGKGTKITIKVISESGKERIYTFVLIKE